MTRKEDVFNSMVGTYYSSCMDLMSAYYQVRMKLDHVKYTAFQVPSRLYEYLVLPMGVSNAPATMHKLTSTLPKDLPHTRSFYDDIHVFTKLKDINEQLRALCDVLEILKKNKLYVKLSKCVFCAEEIPCLGDFIGPNEVRIDPDKVQTIRDWPVPRTQEQFQSFLGLSGNVQRFCERYAELTAPLFTLLKIKNQRKSKITLNAAQLKNFKDFKRRLSDTPVLHLPDFTQQIYMRTDASQYGDFFQIVNGTERSVAYISLKMKPAEFKYPTQQQELLAIVNAPPRDHLYIQKSLEGISEQKMANRHHLTEYQPIFTYLPGTKNSKNSIADALNRSPDMEPETKEFYDLLVLSYNETSYQLRIAEIRSSSDIIKAVVAGYTKDKVIREIRHAIQKREEPIGTRGLTAKQYKPYIEEKMILYQGLTNEKPRIVVPNAIALKHRIIAEVQDSNYGGHSNTDRTSHTRGLMEPLQLPDERWGSISMDFITDLPRGGHNSIWVVVDRLTKHSHFIATTKTVSAPEVAIPFIDNIWRLHGMPQNIISDRGTKFISGFWSQVFENVGTKLKMAVAYRAQGDGQTERINRTPEAYLRFFVSPLQDYWDVHLANAEFAINSSVNPSIKMSPFEAELGYVPRKPLTTLGPKWIGPYLVVRKVHKHAYELNLPSGLKLQSVFNTGSLKPNVGQLVIDNRKRKGTPDGTDHAGNIGLEAGNVVPQTVKAVEEDAESASCVGNILPRKVKETEKRNESATCISSVGNRVLRGIKRTSTRAKVSLNTSHVDNQVSHSKSETTPARPVQEQCHVFDGMSGRQVKAGAIHLEALTEVSELLNLVEASINDSLVELKAEYIVETVLLKPETSPEELIYSSGFTKPCATRLGSEILKNPKYLVHPVGKEFSVVYGTRSASCLAQSVVSRGIDLYLASDAFFAEKANLGMVRESKSPHSTPTFCVRKPNGKWHLVHAYNKLKIATVPAQTPIPRKGVLLNGMSSCTLYISGRRVLPDPDVRE
ncbi:Retrotransposon Polyprotein [Phytophthora palmivora]|uniref:Retrotransposon Polyprotein n=1 Tax=Phytophthora palmivora TaxID=4796 RepID=A0A2P4XBH6_9STRA|nr:Retrotransposon Polyprotein [Phytophthora palmivora]